MRNINRHDVAPRLACKLVYRFGFSRAGATIEKAGKALAESLLLHTLAYLVVFLGSKECGKARHLVLDTLCVEQLLCCYGAVLQQVGNLFLLCVDFHFAKQRALGLLGEFVACVVGNAVHADVLYKVAFHQCVFPITQFGFALVEVTCRFKDVLHLGKAYVVVVIYYQLLAEQHQQQQALAAEVASLNLFHKLDVTIVLKELVDVSYCFLRVYAIVAKVVED